MTGPSGPAPVADPRTRGPRFPRGAELRARGREALPLLAIALAFLAGAAAASLARIRLFNSPFPLWILLVMNGAVAAVAGSAALFVEDPDLPVGDDESVVRVPRAQWEALIRRLESSSRSVAQAPPSTPPAGEPEWSESSLPSLAIAPAMSPPSDPRGRRGPGARRPGPAPPEPVPASATEPAEALRREIDSLEVQGIAESALATAETLGARELSELIRASGPELAGIALRWDVPGPADERSDALLVRLLRELARRTDIPTGRRSRDEILTMAAQLDARREATPPRPVPSLPPESPVATAPAAPSRTPAAVPLPEAPAPVAAPPAAPARPVPAVPLAPPLPEMPPLGSSTIGSRGVAARRRRLASEEEPAPPAPAPPPSSPLGSPDEELERLLQELESSKDGRRAKRPDPSRPDAEPPASGP